MLRTDATFAAEQLQLWNNNRTGKADRLTIFMNVLKAYQGVLSAAPRSLGIANPSHLFDQAQFTSVIQDAKNRIPEFAASFSNGNDNLRRGIEAQHRLVLRGLEANKGGPVEFNFGK